MALPHGFADPGTIVACFSSELFEAPEAMGQGSRTSRSLRRGPPVSPRPGK